MKKTLKEEAEKTAKELIENEIKEVKGKLVSMEKKAKEKEVDWIALRKKAATAPEIEKPVVQEKKAEGEDNGRLVDE